MTKGNLIRVASTAIGRCVDRSHAHYALLIRAGVLYCVPHIKARPGDSIIAKLTHRQIDQGLSDSEWSRVGDKLVKIFERLTL